jgi:DNA-binding XRE family transcriptional regulator
MEQDDKVSSAALLLGSATSSALSVRAHDAREREHGSVMGEVVDGRAVQPGVALDESADGQALEESVQTPAPEANGQNAANESSGGAVDEKPSVAPEDSKTPKKTKNNVRKIRIERMMSKAELARRATLSVLTIDRVERGYGCRMDTKRKILEALGLSLADRVRVFGEEE